MPSHRNVNCQSPSRSAVKPRRDAERASAVGSPHCYTNEVAANSRWPGANLFRNPFGELTRSERAELAVVDFDGILKALCEPSDEDAPRQFRRRSAYQLIGDCGRGKTTRMLAIAKQFPTASYVYLPEDQPCPAIAQGEPLLIDEAQRMPDAVLRTVLKSELPVVLATHRDLAPILRRQGYHVTTEAIGLSLCPELLAEILNRRILASRRDPHRTVPVITSHQAEVWIQRFGTDVRAIEDHLYEVVQAQVNHHGEMRFID